MSFLFLSTLLAQTIPGLPTQGIQSTCYFGLPCSGGGFNGMQLYIQGTIFPFAQQIFVAVAILMFLYYGVRLLIEGDEESAVTEVRSAYSYGITGAAIVSLTSLILQAVGQTPTTRTLLVNTVPAGQALGLVTDYYRYMVAAAVSAIIIYQGVRLIVAQGDDAEIQKQKKSFFFTLVGVSVILLVNAMVGSFLPSTGGHPFAIQLVGIANFLLELLGALAVLSFIAAGFFLVISTDDTLKEKAKKTMFTTVVTLVVVLTCKVIITFVINL